MTTTIDPFNSPYTIFNKSGSTLQVMSIPGGSVENLSVPSGVSHVVVDVPTTGPFPTLGEGLRLPTDATIGDIVYVYVIGAWPLNVLAPIGGTISGTPEVTVPSTNGSMFLKYDDENWAVLAR